MENQSLTDIIQESLATVEPDTNKVPVNQTEDQEPEDSDEVGIDDLIGDLDEDEEFETDEVEDNEEGDEDPHLAETYQVKVDGEVVEISLKEALAGYQRQADYTRKAQALAAEREELISAQSEFAETLNTLGVLDEAWDENPVQVLAHFTANTDNPTMSLALLIKELATANLLDQEFLEMFGITKEVRQTWGKDTEVEQLKRKVSKSEQEKQTKAQEAAYEAEVAQAMNQYELQIDEILAAEGLKLKPSQRDAFRTRLAQYAYENELTNLKAAYKALKYEESQKKKQVAEKTKERAKQKKNASVVGRSGAGSAGAKPISDGSDLTEIIRQTMGELSI
jgi:hypothetical protein